ncbi:MAG: RNA polymerase-binding protein DksA [Legionellaceae bacterium]|nr:RNA polymerase-binding protein DksA [Legionellaceae bacterium]
MKKKKSPTKKSATKKTVARKKVATKKPTKKTTAKKSTAKKTATVTSLTKRAAAKPPAKKSAAKRSAKTKLAIAEFSSLDKPSIKPLSDVSHDDYMGPEMTAHFQRILLAYKAQLREKVDGTMHYMQDDSANLPDLNDRASLEEEFSLELRTRDRERKLIKKIDESLQLIDDGEYGYCEACGVEIGVRRLEARPTAVLCIDCKTIEEMKERQAG